MYPRGEEKKGKESLFKELIDEKFPNQGKKVDIQVQDANRTPSYLNAKRPSPRQTILKVSKVNNKEF